MRLEEADVKPQTVSKVKERNNPVARSLSAIGMITVIVGFIAALLLFANGDVSYAIYTLAGTVFSAAFTYAVAEIIFLLDSINRKLGK